jgi:hypothetical protein
MALIDSSIYQNAPKSLLREGLMGYDRAMQSRDANSQRMDAETKRKLEEQKRMRQQSFNQNLSGLMASSGEYGHTPEGQREIFDHMARAGYGQEMAEFMGGIPMTETPAKNNMPQWHGSTDGRIFNSTTGEFKSPPVPEPAIAQPQNQSPIAASTAPVWKGEKFVRARNNTMVKVDSKGRDESGNPVELWTAPAKPTAGAKPPAPPKGLSGDAAKTLSIASTLQDDIKSMSDAFTKDFAGSTTGLKTGTNRYLIKIADQISDKVGRLRSGGAVNADEEARFQRLISSLRDAAFSNAEEANLILNDLSKEAAFVAEGMDPGGAIRTRIRGSIAPKTEQKAQTFTKPEEEDEYQAWKKAQK